MKLYRITRLDFENYLLFVEGTDAAVRADPNPMRLAQWAFDNGADRVRHEYNLKFAEEESWGRADRKVKR